MGGTLPHDRARRYRELARDIADDEIRAAILKLAAEYDQMGPFPAVATLAPQGITT